MLRELPISYSDFEEQRRDLELWLKVHESLRSCSCFCELEPEAEADPGEDEDREF